MPTAIHAPAVQLKSVLIATDFSPVSEKPLRHALAIAHHFGAKFTIAHVVSSLGLDMAGPEAVAVVEDAVRRDAARLESELTASGALTGLRHQTILRHGDVWKELEGIIRSEAVDLVVIGTHGRRGVGKLLLGSVAEQIFRHADCPVLTVGPGSYREAHVGSVPASRTLLFPTDFSETSRHALPHAVAFANRFGAQLIFLHVVPAIPMPKGYQWYTASDLMQMRENAREERFRRLDGLAHDSCLDVKPDCVVEFGSASSVSEMILESAHRLNADGIVMGLHQHKHVGTTSHLPWATAYEVVCGAGCPVLTVKS